MSDYKKQKERKGIMIEKSLHTKLKTKSSEEEKSIVSIVEELIELYLEKEIILAND